MIDNGFMIWDIWFFLWLLIFCFQYFGEGWQHYTLSFGSDFFSCIFLIQIQEPIETQFFKRSNSSRKLISSRVSQVLVEIKITEGAWHLIDWIVVQKQAFQSLEISKSLWNHRYFVVIQIQILQKIAFIQEFFWPRNFFQMILRRGQVLETLQSV